MMKLIKPRRRAKETFTLCISKVRNRELKNKLERITPFIEQASADFEAAATRGQFHQVPPISEQALIGGEVESDEMEKVYSDRMVKKTAPGRIIYDELFNSSPGGKCSLCGHRQVMTLDHHLPKAKFPALAVDPLNLVPACSDCNKTKLEKVPSTSAEVTLHPYFDDIDEVRWLSAEVVHGQPPALRFFVSRPSDWDELLLARVKNHFEVFKLESLFSFQAADELSYLRYHLFYLFQCGGAESVKLYLLDYAESCLDARKNGWKTATYLALSSSDWFCNGGFNWIG